MTSSMTLIAQDRILRDLAAFADSRTQIHQNGDEFTWTWKRKSRMLKVVEWGRGAVPERVMFNGRESNYAEFFASEEMGALSWLAEEIERSLSVLKGNGPAVIIPAKVRADDDGVITTFEKALKEITGDDAGRTSLVFLQGRAGDGKSTSLIELARKQASQFAAGRSSFLYLYIDAQGRALSRLDEAVALILDDLNSNFRYQSLAVLTRLGLMVPIVDGFDELLGSGGYVEAFASLETFLFRLEGQGTVVTSARATFYQQSALSRAAARLSAASSTVNIAIHNIHLLPWDRESTRQLLQELGVGNYLLSDSFSSHDEDIYSAAERHIGVGADEVLSSPLLTGAYVSLLKEEGGDGSRAEGSIVEAAIRALVQREIKQKLLGAHGDQILDERLFEQLFASVAEEMWWQEARTLDDETLILVAEMTLEHQGIDKNKLGALLGRLTSNAVIELGEGVRKFSFRHEIYFSYFLGNYFKGLVIDGSRKELARLLSRSILPETLARQCGWLLRGDDEVNRYYRGLAEPMVDSAASEVININRGSLIGGALRHSGRNTESIVVRQSVFSGTNLSGVHVNNIKFDECNFYEVDITGMHAPGVVFINCVFRMPLVDENTIVDFTGLRLGEEVVGLRVRKDGKEFPLYRVAQNEALMRKLGLQGSGWKPVRSLDERQQRMFENVEKIVRFISKSMYFSKDDFENRRFRTDLLQVGERNGIWTAADKQRSGVRTLYRLSKSPDALIAGAVSANSDVEILAFWDDVFKLA